MLIKTALVRNQKLRKERSITVNKETKAFVLLMVILTGVVQSSCSVADWYMGRYVPFVGSWKFKDSAQGPQIIKFKRDMTYEIDIDGNGAKDIWGQYKLIEHQLTLQATDGTIGSDCHEGAVYLYRKAHGELNFTLVGDQCRARVSALSQTRVRVK